MPTAVSMYEFQVQGVSSIYTCYFDVLDNKLKSSCTCANGEANDICWHRYYILAGKNKKLIESKRSEQDALIEAALKTPSGARLIREARGIYPSAIVQKQVELGMIHVKVPAFSVPHMNSLSHSSTYLTTLTVAPMVFCATTIAVVLIKMKRQEFGLFDLFVNLGICALVYLVVGLINPKASLFWYKKQQNRATSSVIYGATFIALCVLCFLFY